MAAWSPNGWSQGEGAGAPMETLWQADKMPTRGHARMVICGITDTLGETRPGRTEVNGESLESALTGIKSGPQQII